MMREDLWAKLEERAALERLQSLLLSIPSCGGFRSNNRGVTDNAKTLHGRLGLKAGSFSSASTHGRGSNAAASAFMRRVDRSIDETLRDAARRVDEIVTL